MINGNVLRGPVKQTSKTEYFCKTLKTALIHHKALILSSWACTSSTSQSVGITWRQSRGPEFLRRTLPLQRGEEWEVALLSPPPLASSASHALQAGREGKETARGKGQGQLGTFWGDTREVKVNIICPSFSPFSTF